MGNLSKLRSGAGRGGNDFYQRAERSRAVPAAELAVADAVLADGGPTARRLATQLREASDVYRLRAPDAATSSGSP